MHVAARTAARIHAAAVGPAAGAGDSSPRPRTGNCRRTCSAARPARRLPAASWRCRTPACPTRRSRAAAGCSSRTCCKSTAAALKEHFVLQKIAEVEKIEIEDEDIDAEIDRIADQTGESSRKVRARLEKDDLIEALATDLLERKALDLILGERDLRGLRVEAGRARAAKSRRSKPARDRGSGQAAEPTEEPPAENRRAVDSLRKLVLERLTV